MQGVWLVKLKNHHFLFILPSFLKNVVSIEFNGQFSPPKSYYSTVFWLPLLCMRSQDSSHSQSFTGLSFIFLWLLKNSFLFGILKFHHMCRCLFCFLNHISFFYLGFLDVIFSPQIFLLDFFLLWKFQLNMLNLAQVPFSHKLFCILYCILHNF